MKIQTLLLIAALASGNFGCAFAQVTILTDDAPAPPSTRDSQIGETENPFGFLQTDSSASDNLMIAPAPPPPSAAVKAAPNDPTSLLPKEEKSTLVDTLVNYDTLNGVGDATMSPVMWGPRRARTSHVARIMLREDCNPNALWVGYQAQRAAECVHMWDKINSQGCLGKGCSHDCGNNCDSCTPVHNRYRASCDSCNAATPGVGLIQTPGAGAPVVSPPVPTITPTSQTTPAPNGAPQENKVAFLPSVLFR